MVIPVNCFDHHILLAVVCILFNPLYWNVVCSLFDVCSQRQDTG